MSVVLDTHALIWFATGAPMAAPALRAIELATRRGDLIVPAICFWEIAMAVDRGRLRLSIAVEEFTAATVAQPGLRVEPLNAEIAVAATRLPGSFHADPADRFIVATARRARAPLVTADRAIIAYAHTGHLQVIAAR